MTSAQGRAEQRSPRQRWITLALDAAAGAVMIALLCAPRASLPSVLAQRRVVGNAASSSIWLPLALRDAEVALEWPTPPPLPTPSPRPTLEPSGGDLTLASDGVDVGGARTGCPSDGEALNPALSGDGRVLLFVSDAADLLDADHDGQQRLYRQDLASGERLRLDGGDAEGAAERASPSADGAIVAFDSTASLTVGDANGLADVHLWREGVSGLTRVGLVPWATDLSRGAYGPSLSADGTLAAFASASPELVLDPSPVDISSVFVQDLIAGAVVRVSVDIPASCLRPSLSADGRYCAFQAQGDAPALGDTNGHDDIYLYDGVLGRTVWVSQAVAGADSGPAYAPRVSGDGAYVAYVSAAGGVPRIMVWSRATGASECISLAHHGGQPNGPSQSPAISADGRWVAFSSQASNLVRGDVNGLADVFLYERGAKTVCLSRGLAGVGANGASGSPTISGDGSTVAFASAATNLCVGQCSSHNGQQQVYVWRGDSQGF